MKYFYDFRRHFYNLLASFANDMRDAAKEETPPAGQDRRQLHSGGPRPGQMDTSHHKTESHFAQNVSTAKSWEREMSGQEAKVIAANNNSNCSAVTIFRLFCPSLLLGCKEGDALFWALLGTMYPEQWSAEEQQQQQRSFYCPKLWHFKCRKPTKQQQHRQWQHYLVNVDDMTRPLRATNKQTITRNRAQDELGRN
nr:uncharacterized protein LOC108085867 [Drosophila kikkawai]